YRLHRSGQHASVDCRIKAFLQSVFFYMKLFILNHCYRFFIDVYAMDFVSVVRKHNGCRQADIAKSDNTDGFLHFDIISFYRDRNTLNKKTGKLSWRLKREGLASNLYSHSIPSFRNGAGARLTVPENTSKLPPTPWNTWTFGKLFKFLLIQSSCFGLPSATKRIFA